MTRPILVCGATGWTGSATVKVLLQKDLPVRAFVHKEDERSSALAAQGAEIFVGDLLDLRDVRRAFKGVKRAYFVYPVIPGLIEATAKFAQAALEAKAEFIVNMSQILALPNMSSNAALDHWVAERLFDRAGTPVSHLQPTIFDELIQLFSGKTIKDGLVLGPFTVEGRFAPISAADLGEVIAVMLADPSGHAGQSYRLVGPVELTPPEIAAAIGKALNKEMRYQFVPGKALIQAGLGRDVPHLSQHFEALTQAHRDGLLAGTNDLVEKIIGRRPETIGDFVKGHRASFE